MPQFSELLDKITVEIKEKQQGFEMIFSQNIIVAHEEDLTKYDVGKALKGCHDGSEHGWNVICSWDLKSCLKEEGIATKDDKR